MNDRCFLSRGAPLLRYAYRLNLLAGVFYLILLAPQNVYAYVDPGTTGMLSQLLYLLFYAAVGGFLYSIRYLKKLRGQIGTHLLKLFRMNK